MDPPPDKRRRLVTAAKALFHSRSLQGTSLADIAQASNVPLGNIYYYFKTKDALAEAVLAEHAIEFKQFTGSVSDEPNPRLRLIKFLDRISDRRVDFAANGCPIGGFASEVSKLNSPLAALSQQIIESQISWVEAQYKAMNVTDAHDRAIQFLAQAQGVISVGHAFQNPGIVARQIERLKSWVRMS